MTVAALLDAARVKGWVLDAAANLFRLELDGQQTDIQLPLAGIHNLRNALAAAAASVAVGIGIDAIRRGLENMQGVKGRLQRLSGPNGSLLIDDTYNANPASLAAALASLSSLPGPHWLVLGDMAELGPDAPILHEQAGQGARAAGCQRLFGFGGNSRRAVRAFGSGAAHFDTIEALVEALRQAMGDESPTLLLKGSRSMRLERVVQALGATSSSMAKQEAQV